VSLWIVWAAELTLRSLLWTVRNGRLYVVVGEVAVLRVAIAKAFDWSAAIILKLFRQFERRMAGSEQFFRWCQVQWIVQVRLLLLRRKTRRRPRQGSISGDGMNQRWQHVTGDLS
jgi:hypothetical protein